MPTFWSPTAPGVQKPGGASWFAVNITNIGMHLQKLTTAMAGTQAQSGALNTAIHKAAIALVATMLPQGTIAAQTKQLTNAFTGAQTQVGSISTSLPPGIATAMTAAAIQAGAFDAILKPLAAALVGTQSQNGTIAAASKQLVTALIGAQTQVGTIAAGLGLGLQSALIGSTYNAALIGAALPSPMNMAMAGTQAQAGVMGPGLPLMSSALGGIEHPLGTIATAHQQLTNAMVGTQEQSGVIMAALKATSIALSASHVQSGAASMLLKQTAAVLAGAQAQSGTLAGALLKAIETMTGTNDSYIALTHVGSAANGGTSITAMPAHAIGQTIFLFIYRDGANAVPTQPASGGTVPLWQIIDAGGASTNACITACFTATATNHTSGVWTNATGMEAVVYSNADPVMPYGGHGLSTGVATGPAGYVAPAAVLASTVGHSSLIEFFGARAVTAWAGAPAGFTQRATFATEVCADTQDLVTSSSSVTQTGTGSSSGYAAATIEVIETPQPNTVCIESIAPFNGAASGTAAVTVTVPTVSAGSKVYALINAQALATPSTPTYNGTPMTLVHSSSNSRLWLYSFVDTGGSTNATVTMPSGLSGAKSLYAFSVRSTSSDSATDTTGTVASFPTTLTAGQVAVLMVGGSTLVGGQASGGRLLQNGGNVITAIADARETTTFTSATTGVNVASITLVLSP